MEQVRPIDRNFCDLRYFNASGRQTGVFLVDFRSCTRLGFTDEPHDVSVFADCSTVAA